MDTHSVAGHPFLHSNRKIVGGVCRVLYGLAAPTLADQHRYQQEASNNQKPLCVSIRKPLALRKGRARDDVPYATLAATVEQQQLPAAEVPRLRGELDTMPKDWLLPDASGTLDAEGVW